MLRSPSQSSEWVMKPGIFHIGLDVGFHSPGYYFSHWLILITSQEGDIPHTLLPLGTYTKLYLRGERGMRSPS